jgi:DAK2 domain fusion protein YloV
VTGALTRAELGPLLDRVHRVLGAHRREVDELNVFPVPDGDTGSNLVATVRSSLDALHAAAGTDDQLVEVVRGAMRGARGNSGVILSQVLRALVEALTDEPLEADGFAALLDRARELAYDAVAEPVEGTILTAIRVAADVAGRERDAELAAVTRRVAVEVHGAVQRTPHQLAALREAGVVDAGARGFELVVDAIHGHLTGEALDEDLPGPHVRRDPDDGRREAGSLEYAFEVQYLLEADGDAVAPLRDALQELGDSVVVVEGGGLLTVHVHTNDVGPAIEAGLDQGRPSRIEVVHFGDQIAAQEAASAGVPDETRTVGCVAVLDGAGLRTIAERHGAVVVPGAAGRLPSVADLLNAAGEVTAEMIVVLPGHPNAVATGRQASAVSRAEGGRDLIVISAARTPASVLAALAVCDPTAGDADAVVADMEEAAAAVRSGEVVAAVRDADTPIGTVREGQLLAVVDGEVRAVSDDPLDALAQVVSGCAEDACEVVTLILGAEVDDVERAAALRRIRDVLRDDVEVDVIDGGQRPVRYAVGTE